MGTSGFNLNVAADALLSALEAYQIAALNMSVAVERIASHAVCEQSQVIADASGAKTREMKSPGPSRDL